MDNTIIDDIQSNLVDIAPNDTTQDIISNYDVQNLSFDTIYQDIIDSIKNTITIPVDLILSLLVCILITAVIQSFNENNEQHRMFSLASILLCIRVVIDPIVQLIDSIQEVMLSSVMFINSYVPIISSIMLADGQIGTSASYGAITYVCCQVWVQFANNIILPLMSVSLALSCISGICPDISLGGIVKVIKKCVTWIMSVSMFIFSGIVTIQGAVSSAGDRVTSKALKFVVSNGVPIVGNAVSDVCETVRSSLGLLKSGVGLVGIVVILITVLPSVVNVGIVRVVITLGETLADMFDVKYLKNFLTDVSAVLSAVFSCTICFVVTFIVSIGAVMLLVGG
ncbi:MAG: stage III sporulation protein AE [Ruminococcus sp.]|nr:stage III sporulation protein AE [Ruminococcus sp.]